MINMIMVHQIMTKHGVNDYSWEQCILNALLKGDLKTPEEIEKSILIDKAKIYAMKFY